jgi:ABC-2 type transport system permease protein
VIRWRTVKTIASFELVSTIKRKGYLIATFGMPIFVLAYGAIISSVGLFVAHKEREVKVYGVVDHAAVLDLGDQEREVAREMPEELRTAVEAMGQVEAIEQQMSWWGNFIFRPYPDEELAKTAVLEDEIKGFFLLDEDYLETGKLEVFAADELDIAGSESRGAFRNLLVDRMLAGRVAPEIAARVRKPIAERVEWTIDDTGEIETRQVATVVAKLVVPVVFAILMFISLMMSAGYLLQGTAVEKENRVVEILMHSANADELMTGKLIGLGGAGLLQVLLWFGMAIFGGLATATGLELIGFEMPWTAMAIAVPFFVAGYLFMGGLMLGTGSLGSNIKESQQLSMFWTLPSIIPLIFMQILVTEPHSLLGRILIWIPFTAPVTVVLRAALDLSGIAWWEIAGSFVMMAAAIWISIRLGARLFRVGLLLTGARPKLREILRQARLSP